MALTRKQKELRKYAVYFLRCPMSNEVRYIGSTSNLEGRSAYHRAYSQTDSGAGKRAWTQSVIDAGLLPVVEVKFSGLSYLAALEVEKYLIGKLSLACPGQIFNKEFRKTRIASTVSGGA